MFLTNCTFSSRYIGIYVLWSIYLMSGNDCCSSTSRTDEACRVLVTPRCSKKVRLGFVSILTLWEDLHSLIVFHWLFFHSSKTTTCRIKLCAWQWSINGLLFFPTQSNTAIPQDSDFFLANFWFVISNLKTHLFTSKSFQVYWLVN